MSPESFQPTLEQVVECLGPGVVTVFAVGAGLRRQVGEPVIRDPLDPGPMEPGDIILVVGVNAGSAEARELVRVAAESRPAAVCFRVERSPDALIRVAENVGVASGELLTHRFSQQAAFSI
jgi:hypothetical protein